MYDGAGKVRVELPQEYQRVPASERDRPSVINHSLLVMTLSLL